MMHREVVARRKVPVIAISLLVITIVLYLSEAIDIAGLEDHIIGEILNTILILFTALVVFKEFKSCKMAYKYAIISDKLIINKINSENEENLESIKICDIVYIGKKYRMPKAYLTIKNRKNYLCNMLRQETYYCIYKENGKIFEFTFQPSDKFIKRIINHSCLRFDNNIEQK